jgi:monomeric sarcosine oxidase
MAAASYDVVVLGAGGVGSAAMWQLARCGLRVLGVDRFAPPHDRGSSHGQSRIIRQAYFEHSDYVPLLVESYRHWRELEARAGCELFRESGLLQVGPPEGAVVAGVLEAARRHRLEVDELDVDEIAARWPAFRFAPDDRGRLAGVFERRAGFLHVEACVAACLDEARRLGAELLAGATVHGITLAPRLTVRTDRGDVEAERVVVAAGAWTADLLAALGVEFEVRRKVLLWYAAADPRLRADAGFPCFLFELDSGVFYGFPVIDGRGLKAAEHTGGAPVADPLAVDRALRAGDEAPVTAFLESRLPAAAPPAREHAVCMYTMSPDEHFIVDRSPADPRIVFAAGLSGHGFKFTPVLGQALADLAVDGRTSLPMGFLSLDRFRS